MASLVEGLLREAVLKAFPTFQGSLVLQPSKFGDYQSNVAHTIFKTVDKQIYKSPPAVADAIAAHLGSDFSSSSTKGGFVTVTLAGGCVADQLVRFTTDVEQRSMKVCVDFSSPNVAKEMHVGHLRSTIIGESICRIFEHAGLTVSRMNHIGDWGTQFGMLLTYVKEVVGEEAVCGYSLDDLGGMYRLAAARFKEDPEFKKRAQDRVVQLQSGDEFSLRVWRLLCDTSRRGFESIYSRLGTTLVERGESFYNSRIPPLISELEARAVIEDVEGARVVFTDQVDPSTRVKYEVPLMVVKSDGGYGYDTTDLAAIRHRCLEDKYEWIVYVTDMGQAEHFQKLFKAASRIGWSEGVRVDHCGFGLVLGEDGKRLRSRAGVAATLVSLLDEAVTRCETDLRQRREEGDDGDISKSAHTIGYAAIKYFDLKQSRTTDYKFSYDRMLDPKGNTAVYLLYAYARICSIFRKCQTSFKGLTPDNLTLNDEKERKLGIQILAFHDVYQSVFNSLHIHHLADYMYNLCLIYTDFYQNNKVILPDDPETQNSRLWLCELTRRTLETCFHHLGIVPLEKL